MNIELYIIHPWYYYMPQSWKMSVSEWNKIQKGYIEQDGDLGYLPPIAPERLPMVVFPDR